MKKIVIYIVMLISIFSTCSKKQRDGWKKRAEKITGEEETIHADTTKVLGIILTEENRAFMKIQLTEARQQKIMDSFETPAILKPHPNAQIVIKAPLEGWIKKLPVEPGSRVKQNELVAVIENPNNLGQRLKVPAPIGGIVTQRYISPNAWVESGEPLLEIADLRHLQAVMQIYPVDQPRVKIGQLVEIITKDAVAKGRISVLSPMADPQTGAVEARADIVSAGSNLTAGAPATAKVLVSEKDALIIPYRALLHEENHWIVYVQRGEEFEKQLVKTGVRADSLVEVVAGIQVGDKVVTRGAYQLKNLSFSTAPTTEEDEEER